MSETIGYETRVTAHIPVSKTMKELKYLNYPKSKNEELIRLNKELHKLSEMTQKSSEHEGKTIDMYFIRDFFEEMKRDFGERGIRLQTENSLRSKRQAVGFTYKAYLASFEILDGSGKIKTSLRDDDGWFISEWNGPIYKMWNDKKLDFSGNIIDVLAQMKGINKEYCSGENEELCLDTHLNLLWPEGYDKEIGEAVYSLK
jgi:hypothetical protein